MVFLLKNIYEFYNFVFTDLADKRTNDWFLISSPILFVTILGLYLNFVISWGPKYMREKQPYKLTSTLFIYDFFQVIISTWIFVESMDGAWLNNYSWKCEPVDYSYSPQSLRVARGVYVYFLVKIVELLDTVFFVLRKKQNQITFLHIYHHTLMPIASWIAVKYYPGGHGIFIGSINSFVHIIMYSYYLLAAFGPKFQKYLWWKKYITRLQMLQFCMIFIHMSQLLFYDCGFPRWPIGLCLFNAAFFYFLFNEFYKQAYSSKKDLNGNANGFASRHVD